MIVSQLSKCLATAVAVASFVAALSGAVAGTDVEPGSTPRPADCKVDPRTTPEIANLASGLTSENTFDSDSQATPGSTILEQDVVDLIWELVACSNANRPLSSLALFTDSYVADRFGPDYPDDLGSLTAATSRISSPAKDEDVLAITSITTELDEASGAVTVRVVTENRMQVFDDVLIIVWVEGEPRVDQVLGTDKDE